jgi:hypothetical protein
MDYNLVRIALASDVDPQQLVSTGDICDSEKGPEVLEKIFVSQQSYLCCYFLIRVFVWYQTHTGIS